MQTSHDVGENADEVCLPSALGFFCNLTFYVDVSFNTWGG